MIITPDTKEVAKPPEHDSHIQGITETDKTQARKEVVKNLQ